MLAATSTSLSTTIWYTMRATGVVALVLLTVTTELGLLSASRVRTRRWPAFAQVELHERATLFALVFLGLHVLTAIVDSYVHVGVLAALVPFTSSFQTFWTGLGTVAVDLLLAVAISSALRQRIDPRTWRGLHWLAYGCWPFAMAHALGTGTDAGQLWMDATAAVCTIAVACALVWRIGTHRTTREVQSRVGATTWAVPPRHRPPTSAPAGSAATASTTGHTVAAPGGRIVASAPTAVRLLERDS